MRRAEAAQDASDHRDLPDGRVRPEPTVGVSLVGEGEAAIAGREAQESWVFSPGRLGTAPPPVVSPCRYGAGTGGGPRRPVRCDRRREGTRATLNRPPVASASPSDDPNTGLGDRACAH